MKINRSLARTAREAANYNVIKRIIVILISSLLVLSSVVYLVSALYSRYGSFTVSIAKEQDTTRLLSLCDDDQFLYPTSKLSIKLSEDITNISKDDLPGYLDSKNGSYNGDNFLAYTFYLKNAGTSTVTYEYAMLISQVTQDVDEAARIRLYHNGEYVDYAKVGADGEPEPETVKFLKEDFVTQKWVDSFAPEDIHRFTVVLWLEGNDPECVDDIIGGQMKIGMTFKIIS